MGNKLLRVVVPAYLLLCLLTGGSVQGEWRVLIVQLGAIGLIAWAALSRQDEPPTAPSRTLMLLAVVSLLLFLLHLIPLPPQLWTQLPGRAVVGEGYRALLQGPPWLPLSMAPYATLATALTLLVPIAALLGMLRFRILDESWIAGAVIAGTLLGVLLGAMQTVGGTGPNAWWYLYDFTNTGAVGFFANRNHMGTLLLTAIPFAIALIAAGNPKSRGIGRGNASLAVGVGALLLILVGLALNRSLAAVMLAIPVIAFSALILPGDWRKQRLIFVTAAVLTVVAVLAFTSSPVQSELAGADTTSLDSRRTIWAQTWAAITASFPFGTGLGSFAPVFRLGENPGIIDATFVNHAHNDYLELVLEAGLPAILLIAAFLYWWTQQAISVWRSPLRSQFARAATIASAAILVHSIVDYPLRTAAMAAVFAACLGLMARPRQSGRSAGDGAACQARHLRIG